MLQVKDAYFLIDATIILCTRCEQPYQLT